MRTRPWSFCRFFVILLIGLMAVAPPAGSRWNLGFIATRIIRFAPAKTTLTDSARNSLMEIREAMAIHPGLSMVLEYPLTSNRAANAGFKKQGAVVLHMLRDSANMDSSRFRFKPAVTLSPNNIRVRMAYDYE